MTCALRVKHTTLRMEGTEGTNGVATAPSCDSVFPPPSLREGNRGEQAGGGGQNRPTGRCRREGNTLCMALALHVALLVDLAPAVVTGLVESAEPVAEIGPVPNRHDGTPKPAGPAIRPAAIR
jgi:hypothetical protein